MRTILCPFARYNIRYLLILLLVASPLIPKSIHAQSMSDLTIIKQVESVAPFSKIFQRNRTLSSPSEVQTLTNEHLRLEIHETGQFILKDVDGRALLYPNKPTSYLSILVNENVYTNYPGINDNGTLEVITPAVKLDEENAYIQYRTPEELLITERFQLQGEAAKFSIEVANANEDSYSIKARYLLDTQVDVNDGSPLYAPGVGTNTQELSFAPTANLWRSYDFWPDFTLVGEGTLFTAPYQMTFARWPEAVQQPFNYDADVSKSFYTPGFVRSPESDSCVLLYFDFGVLESNSTAEVATYYGTGNPTLVLDRTTILNKIAELRDTTKNSILTDLDASTYALALYIDTLQTDHTDYIEAGWTLASLAISTPDAGTLTKLANDAGALTKFADILGVVDTAADGAAWFAGIVADIPTSKTADEIQSEYIYPYFFNEHEFGNGVKGVAGLLQQVDFLFNNNVAVNIPDPLPDNYPIERVVRALDTQIAKLNDSKSREVQVPLYRSNMTEIGVLGNTQEQLKFMTLLSDNFNDADDFGYKLTLTEISVFAGAGVLKIAGVVGTPFTFGGSTAVVIPTEAVLWGGAAAITTIPSIISIIPTSQSLSYKGAMTQLSYSVLQQMINDTMLRVVLFEETGSWVVGIEQPVRSASLHHNTTDNLYTVDSLVIDNIVTSDSEIVGTGMAQLELTNVSSSKLTVAPFGRIIANTGAEKSTINLFANDAVEIEAGIQTTINIPLKVFRSTLVDGNGYEVLLSLAIADSNGPIQIDGPYTDALFVGTDSQLSVLDSQKYDVLARGVISGTEVITQSVVLDISSNSTELSLNFADGSDLDLHLYDALGNHVGIDYDSGIVENEIKGVEYSGANSSSEWMRIPSGLNGLFTEVIPQNTLGGNGFSLTSVSIPLLPAIMDSEPETTWNISSETVTNVVTRTFTFPLTESGGDSPIIDLVIETPNFEDELRFENIPSPSVSCIAPTSIQPSETILVQCTMQFSSITQSQRFSGAFTVRGRGNDTELSTQTTVNLEVDLIKEKGFCPVPPLGTSQIVGDLDGDMDVDSSDADIMQEMFSGEGCPGFHPADINLDGVIDVLDNDLLIANFGTGVEYYQLLPLMIK